MLWPLVGSCALWLPLAATAPAAAPAPTSDRFELVTKTGKVVELSAALKATGLSCDNEPIAQQVVLQEPDGMLTPLLSDDASRAFFRDERLRNRRVEIRARRYAGLPYLQVLSFQVEEDGRLQTPEYF